MEDKRVLVACEESQRVTVALREQGVTAFSCDLLPESGGPPEWHIQKDVFEVLEEKWDAVIAFPPCTHLASSGAAWFEQKRKDGRQQLGIDFFLRFTQLENVPYVMIENPIGIMSSIYRKPDQYIQPYEYGDPTSKRTCLWLKGFPPLTPTNIVDIEYVTMPSGKKIPKWHRYTNNLSKKNGLRARERSKTFPGVAKAIATQWSPLLK